MRIGQTFGKYGFDIFERGLKLCRVSLKVFGRHNVYNALAACAAARQYGISGESIKEGLEGFLGMKRRFEFWGRVNGAEVYHDYAHHPQEIAATLAAARALPHSRIISVFQPHTYTRTQKLFGKFAEALSGADINILAEIYPAREKPIRGVTSAALKDALIMKGNCAYHCADFETICQRIKEFAKEGDIVLVLGAGDVDGLKKGLF
jgi:UDP-N-acetylmuramate--alanine ligase